MAKDYYKILGVDRNASEDDIKRAFRKLAHEYHPDMGGDPEKFKEINEAYQVLGNKEKKAQYDQFGANFEDNNGQGFNKQGFKGFDFSNFQQDFNFDSDFDLGDIFDGFFGGRSAPHQTSRNKYKRGEDIRVEVEISFLEAVFGVKKEIRLKKIKKCDNCDGLGHEPNSTRHTCNKCGGTGKVNRIVNTFFGQMRSTSECDECQGTGIIYDQKCSKCKGAGFYNDYEDIKIDIPAGIDNEEVLRLSGEGNAGVGGGQNGDLYITVIVKDDKYFKREKYNILTTLEISFPEAALGTKKVVKTVYGDLLVNIPAGIQSGTVIKLENKGIKKLNGRGYGDHLITVIVKTPTRLTSMEKKMYEEMLNK